MSPNSTNGNDVTVVRRLPATKVFRAHLVGLASAVIFPPLAVFLAQNTIAPDTLAYVTLLLILFAILGMFFGGAFVFIAVLFSFIPTTETVQLVARWYVIGYFSGAIFSMLYNALVYLYLITLGRKRNKVVFKFSQREKFNVIKSPDLNEETVQTDSSERLYDYKVEVPPPKPYTIAFVANPKILKRHGSPTNASDFGNDPIVEDLDLFLSSVDRALASFESDDVLGRPEIWSRIRIIALFDESLANAHTPDKRFDLVHPYENSPMINGRIAENLLDSVKEMKTNYQNMLRTIDETLLDKYGEPDVIFGLSAISEFDRSTARYTDWEEGTIGNPNTNLGEEEYDFDPDPGKNKGAEINMHSCTSTGPYTCKHEPYAKIPGRVALNVLGASSKTYIHEFAHAMSSAFCGTCVDEYYDIIELNDDNSENEPEEETPFYINRIERARTGDGKIVPVHNIFAKYNGTIYYSDRDHPSAEEDWLGYFPDRQSSGVGCTMDRYYGGFRFDPLISDFMYDRLITKINRT